jgi:alpha-amylase
MISMRFLAALFNAVLGILLTAVLVLVVVLFAEETAVETVSVEPRRSVPVVKAGDTPRTVMVQLFEWRWDDIAVECETFLGPMGFAAVQVSPPNEHRLMAGSPWWQRYQPVSYRLDSRSGDAAAFAAMVRRCADAGIKVYADAVVNHMTAQRSTDDPLWGTGSGGSTYEFQQYPDYESADFHQPSCEIGSNDRDRRVVQNCALSGRADLDTEADQVQNRIGAYLSSLLDLGVSGFRIDSAKHMAAGDIAGILARVEGLPFVYQQVLDGPADGVRAREYLANGMVTEFGYGDRLAAAFRSGDISVLKTLQPGLSADELLPDNRALVFIDNHETQRGLGTTGGLLTQRDGALYDLANVFMLGWPYGAPRVMSSYEFADADAGPPSAEDGRTLAVHGADGLGCSQGWVCEHRRPAIAGMVAFRNHTDGAELANWWSDEDTGGRIAFGRGERGFVVINNTDEPMHQWLRTGLPPGRYCNAVASRSEEGACTAMVPSGQPPAPEDPEPTGEAAVAADPAIEVAVGEDGSATFELPPRSAAAIYVGLRPASGSAGP